MKVYVVQNNDGILLAVFRKKEKARNFVRTIGRKRWGERWKIEPIELNKVDQWILVGSEEYNLMKRRFK